MSLVAIVCEGDNCTTIIIELFVIFGQFGSYSICVTYFTLLSKVLNSWP